MFYITYCFYCGFMERSIKYQYQINMNIPEDRRPQYIKRIEKFSGETFGKSGRWKGRTESGSCG